MDFRGTIKIEKGEIGYVATCLENDVTSQGKTIEKALENVKEAISLYYEDNDDVEVLKNLQNREILIAKVDVKI